MKSLLESLYEAAGQPLPDPPPVNPPVPDEVTGFEVDDVAWAALEGLRRGSPQPPDVVAYLEEAGLVEGGRPTELAVRWMDGEVDAEEPPPAEPPPA